MPMCPNCGSQQPEGAAFCDECGAKLEQRMPAAPPPAAMPPQPSPTVVATTCPSCGVTVIPGEVFCDNCGAALGPAAPTPPVQPPVPVQPPPPPTHVSALACQQCGAQLEPGSIFCDMCGTPVSAPAPAAAPPQPAPLDAVPPPTYAPMPPTQPPPATYPAPPTQPPPTTYPAPAYPPGVAIQGRLVVQGSNASLPFPSGKTAVIVGREDPVSGVFPEIDLTDHGADESGVSRQHARVFLQGSQILVEDLNSTNFTYVNQQKLTPGQPHPLNNGDEVRFGRMKLNFYST